MTNSTKSTRTASPGNMLRWIGAFGIAMILVVRATNIFAPQVLFDVDPAMFPFALGFGPAGSLGLDVALLLASALALLGETIAGRRIDALPILLALLPFPIVLSHGLADAHDMWRGMTWVSAAVAAGTLAHLQRDRSIRLAMIGILLAIIAPLLVRGIMQVSIEHHATLAAFEETRDQFYADRGWTPDSPAARIYERRLRQPQPTAWFPTSNVLATVLLTTTIAWLGLGIAGVRNRAPSGWTGVAFGMAILALGGITITGSKGALGAVAIGILLILVPVVLPKPGELLRRRAVAMSLAVIACALLAIVARGLLMPEGILNERSLLFRWHYLIGAGRMMLEAPLLGVGPDGFQAAYEIHRPPRSPEEVTSAHSVFIDWLAMLGVIGFAWVSLVLVLLCRAARGATGSRAEMGDVHQQAVSRLILAVFMGAMIIGFVAQWATVSGDTLTLVTRVLGFGVAALLAGVAARLAEVVDRRRVTWTMLIAVVVLLVHTQIEMTFWQAGAVVWCFAVLGVVGGTGLASPRSVRIGRAAGGAVAIVAMITLFTAFIPAWSQQRIITRAAKQLSVPELEDPPYTTIDRRLTAVDELVRAYERWPTNMIPLLDAARQRSIAAAMSGPGEREHHLQMSIELLDRAIDEHRHNALLVERINVRRALHEITGETSWIEPAVADARELTGRSPHSIASWKRLGDILWTLDQPDEARSAYTRSLANDANFELDPLKRLSEEQRKSMEERIERVTS